MKCKNPFSLRFQASARFQSIDLILAQEKRPGIQRKISHCEHDGHYPGPAFSYQIYLITDYLETHLAWPDGAPFDHYSTRFDITPLGNGAEASPWQYGQRAHCPSSCITCNGAGMGTAMTCRRSMLSSLTIGLAAPTDGDVPRSDDVGWLRIHRHMVTLMPCLSSWLLSARGAQALRFLLPDTTIRRRREQAILPFLAICSCRFARCSVNGLTCSSRSRLRSRRSIRFSSPVTPSLSLRGAPLASPLETRYQFVLSEP
jgi:hypothetical protein